MRRGELCGPSWDDIDFDRARIIVRWQITAKAYQRARAAER
jgi:integrase